MTGHHDGYLLAAGLEFPPFFWPMGYLCLFGADSIAAWPRSLAPPSLHGTGPWAIS